MMRRAGLLLALIAVTVLTGCNRAGVSGAGMMRVEVEVYRGPVGQSQEMQIGELSALLSEAVKGTQGWTHQALALANDSGLNCSAAKDASPDCTILRQALSSATDIAASICRISDYQSPTFAYTDQRKMGIFDACAETRLQLGAPGAQPRLADTSIGARPTSVEITGQYREFSRRISVVSSEMWIKAHRLTAGELGYVPRDKRVRYMIASLGFLLGETSNTIAARNLILSKTIERCQGANGVQIEHCSAGSKLPTGDYLRDVAPTRFMEAFEWFNAALPSTGTGAYARRNRSRAIEELTGDYYWEKVNEVYASGQGDVSMAFVKDELGNWNLKSYTNDPAKLLEAYRGAANAAIASAVKLARKAGGDPTALAGSSKLFDLADRLATGGAPATPPGPGIGTLRARTVARLETAQKNFKDREEALTKAGGTIEAKKTALSDAKAAVATADGVVDSSQKTVARTAADVDQCVSETCAAKRELYRQALDALNKALAAQSAAVEARSKAEVDLALAESQKEDLPVRAAELADQILTEYQHELSILQETAVPATALAAKPPVN